MMKIFKPPKNDKLIGNDLKDYVQFDVTNVIIRSKHIIVEAATGFGKTKIACDFIQRLNKHRYDYKILIIVPRINLKEQWEKMIKERNLNNVDVIVINSFLLNKVDVNDYFAVFVDECHKILNKDATLFSTTLVKIINQPYVILLTATLKKEFNEFIESCGEFDKYVISFAWCCKHDLIPENININIPVTLTLQEKSKIFQVQLDYDKYSKYFANYKIFNPFEKIDDYNQFNLEKGQIIGMMNKWKIVTNSRRLILQNATGKNELTLTILQYLNEKVLIFGKNIKNIEQLTESNDKVVCYHSKIGKKQKEGIFKSFFLDEKPYLATINTIIEGFDIDIYAKSLNIVPTVCKWIIRMCYDSESLKTIQTFGRILRFSDENTDASVMVNLYVDDFEVRNKTYNSQEKKWLIDSLKGQVNVRWMEFDDFKEEYL